MGQTVSRWFPCCEEIDESVDYKRQLSNDYLISYNTTSQSFAKETQPVYPSDLQVYTLGKCSNSNNFPAISSIKFEKPKLSKLALLINYKDLNMNVEDLDSIRLLMNYCVEKQVFVFHNSIADDLILIPPSAQKELVDNFVVFQSNGIWHIMGNETTVRDFPYYSALRRNNVSDIRPKAIISLDSLTKNQNYSVKCGIVSGDRIEVQAMKPLLKPNEREEAIPLAVCFKTNSNFRQVSFIV